MEYHFYLRRDGVTRRDMELLPLDKATLRMDSTAAVHTRLSAVFAAVEGADLLHDRILLELDGSPAGEFLTTSCQSRYDGDCLLWQLEAKDAAWLLQRSRLEQRLCLPAGASYMEEVQKLLRQAGIQRIRADRCSETLSTPRQWELGESRLSIVGQLLEEMGFAPLSFDGEGWALLRQYVSPQKQAVSHIFGSEVQPVERDCVSSLDLLQAANVFVVVADSPRRSDSLRATASNDDPNSPISTVHLGRIMAEVTVLEDAPSQEALQRCADRLRDESLLSAQTVEFYTKPCLCPAGSLVALEHPQLSGLYREQGWLMELGQESRMKHEGRSVMLL